MEDFCADWLGGWSVYPDKVRAAAVPVGVRAGFSPSVSLVSVAVEVLRRPKSSDGRTRWPVAGGLAPVAPLQVADAGNRGGGISPCLGGGGAGSSVFCGIFRTGGFCEGCDAALEGARRQPLKLNFRLREEPEEGVSGSVEVEVCADSEASFFCCGRNGPAAGMLCISTFLLYWYSPLGRDCRRANSPLPLGNEFDEKGVVACRAGFKFGIGMVPMLGVSSRAVGVLRKLYAELLLRRCFRCSYWSCWVVLEKKVTLDAVIGVLGVLLVERFGGGVRLRSSTSAEGAGKEENRLLKGVPSGRRFNGGSLIGCRFFLLECCTVGGLSGSDPEPTVSPLRCLMDPALFWE